MANTVYSNFVLQDKITDLLTTYVNTRSLMTIDNTLAENAGMKKTINTYTYSGSVSSVAERSGNTSAGSASFVGKDYTVAVLQQKADYTDEDIMKDDAILDVIMKGASQVMVNKLTADFYTALEATDGAASNPQKLIGTTTFTKGGSIGYETIVDAIADMNVEDESQLFLLISPVIVSKALTGKNKAYLMTKEAITCFMKKDVEVEQDRNPNTRVNDVYFRTAYVVAITDATKARRIEEASA